jgi:hypothetical protein
VRGELGVGVLSADQRPDEVKTSVKARGRSVDLGARVHEVVIGVEHADVALAQVDTPAALQLTQRRLVALIELPRARAEGAPRLFDTKGQRADRAYGRTAEDLADDETPRRGRVVHDHVGAQLARFFDQAWRHRGRRRQELQPERLSRVVVGRGERPLARVSVSCTERQHALFPLRRERVHDFVSALDQGPHQRQRRMDVPGSLHAVERGAHLTGPSVTEAVEGFKSL